MRSIKSCKFGDIIVDSTGGKCRVLGRINDIVFRSEYFRYEIPTQHFLSIQELEQGKWKILTKDGRTPMTLSEVEDLMNIKICDTRKQSSASPRKARRLT